MPLLTPSERIRMKVELKLVNIIVDSNIRSNKLMQVHNTYVVEGKKYNKGIYGIRINGTIKKTKGKKQREEERKKLEEKRTSTMSTPVIN
jgi:hypothetical protein